MASQFDVFQVVLKGTILGQTFLNAFYYRLEDAPSPGHFSGLLNTFDATVVAPYVAQTTVNVTFDTITAKNIFTGDEGSIIPVKRIGERVGAGQVLPSFMAAHVKLIRGNNRVRHGHKYVVGLCENDSDGNVWTSASMAFTQVLANSFAAQLNAGGVVDVFKPVILGRIRYNPEPGKFAYRLPTSVEEMGDQWSYVTAALVSPGVTTMRSRKEGHGV